MSDTLHSHIILCEAMSFSQGKTRPVQRSAMAKFLSSLALVLNGSTACTAVYVHKAEKTVLISRNEPTTPMDERYFNRFFTLIRLYADTCFDEQKIAMKRSIFALLTSIVLEYNSKKIIKHCVGKEKWIVDKLRKMAQLDANKKSILLHKVRSNQQPLTNNPLSTDKLHFIEKNLTEDDYIQFIFETLKVFLSARDGLIDQQGNPTDEQLESTIIIACVLYESRLFRRMLDAYFETSNEGEYYFEKASAHKRSLNLLLKCLLFEKDRYFDIYKHISWKLVQSLEKTYTLSVSPKKALQNLLDKMCLSDPSLLKIIATKKIEDFYPDDVKRIESFEKDQELQVCVHAEVLLVDHLLKNNIDETSNTQEIEIGISKMCCLLCYYYIDKLNEKHHRCFCQPHSTNGKIYAKWHHREHEDATILDSINEKLVDKLKQAITHSCFSSRAGPLRSGDSDIMSTSLEAKQFDEEQFQIALDNIAKQPSVR